MVHLYFTPLPVYFNHMLVQIQFHPPPHSIPNSRVCITKFVFQIGEVLFYYLGQALLEILAAQLLQFHATGSKFRFVNSQSGHCLLKFLKKMQAILLYSGLPPNQGNQRKSGKLRYYQGKSGKKYWFNEKGKIREFFNFVVFILMFLNVL